MLHGQCHFFAAYIDIDNFKPFDTLVIAVVMTLFSRWGSCVPGSGEPRRFLLGAVGGMILFHRFSGEDWESRCWQLVELFSQTMNNLLSLGARQEAVIWPKTGRGTRLSQRTNFIDWCRQVCSRGCESPRKVAAAATVAKQAKKKCRSRTFWWELIW